MWEFKFYSRGGQGAVTSSKILINAAIIDGKFAQAIPSYGQERKGAPVYTYARIDDKSIDVKSYVYRPNCVIVFDLGLPDLGIDIYDGLRKDSIIIANGDDKSKISHQNLKKTVMVKANEITKEVIGEDVPPNIAMLGAVAKATGCVSYEALEKAILAKIPGKEGELNAKACRRAYEEASVYEEA